MIRAYLDNCCFNRPFDDQTQMKVVLETQAKLRIQQMILDGRLELVWSFILEYENEQNPSEQRRERIGAWRELAHIRCDLTEDIRRQSAELMSNGFKQKDALHLACAIAAGAECLITTDAGMLNKAVGGIRILNPVVFVIETEGK